MFGLSVGKSIWTIWYVASSGVSVSPSYQASTSGAYCQVHAANFWTYTHLLHFLCAEQAFVMLFLSSQFFTFFPTTYMIKSPEKTVPSFSYNTEDEGELTEG